MRPYLEDWMANWSEMDDVAYTLVQMHLDNALPIPDSVDVLMARMFPDADRATIKTAIDSATLDHILMRMAMLPGLTPRDCLGALHEARKISRDRAIEILFGKGATMEEDI